MVPMALVGAARYRMNPDIEVSLPVALLLAAGGVAGALIGSSLAGWMSAVSLRRLFAVVMILAAVRLLTTTPERGEPEAVEPPVNPDSLTEGKP
jgi:uncharacterized membrane protein YfcA